MFTEKYRRFWEEFGSGRTMVLAAARGENVSARMMSVVVFDGKFWFQTDRTFRKYAALAENPHAALCIDNISVEGVTEEHGHPSGNAEFSRRFAAVFPGSFASYSALENERVFSLTPQRIERWLYIDGKPYIEQFDIAEERYSLCAYEGV